MEGLMDDVYKPDLKVDLPEEHLSFSVSLLLYLIDPTLEYLQ